MTHIDENFYKDSDLIPPTTTISKMESKNYPISKIETVYEKEKALKANFKSIPSYLMNGFQQGNGVEGSIEITKKLPNPIKLKMNPPGSRRKQQL